MKLSIITVNLNNCAGLQRTIDSILAQTWRDFEWIVIDGGSTDGSKELIERYAEYFSYWVSEPDNGIYNAMNKGIRMAKGEYLNFMNSGDRFAGPEVLRDVFENLSPADIVYGICVQKDAEGKDQTLGICRQLEWYDLLSANIPHQAAFYKRSCFDRIGGYDERYHVLADWRFNATVLMYYGGVATFLPLLICYYEGGGASETDKAREEHERLCQETFPLTVRKDIPWLISSQMIRRHFLSRVIYSLCYRAVAFYERFFD